MKAFRSEKGKEETQSACRALYAELPSSGIFSFLDTREFGKTHVFISGPEEAPPLVLLHGTSNNLSSWKEYLYEWESQFRCYALDIPGQPGLSAEERPSLNDGGMTRWLDESLAALELDKVHFCGRSMGGLIALEYGVRRPEAVCTMSLLTPGGIAPFRRSFFLRALPHLALGEKGVRKIHRMVRGSAERDAAAEDFAVLSSRHFKPVTERVPIFPDGEIRSICFPLLYIAGSKDAMLRTRSSAKRLRTLLPDAEVRLIEGMGHAVVGQAAAVGTFIKTRFPGHRLSAENEVPVHRRFGHRSRG